jgi:hypothetical protein
MRTSRAQSYILILKVGSGKMVHQEKVFFTKPVSQNLVSIIHVVEGENQLLKIPSDPHILAVANVDAHTQSINACSTPKVEYLGTEFNLLHYGAFS